MVRVAVTAPTWLSLSPQDTYRDRSTGGLEAFSLSPSSWPMSALKVERFRAPSWSSTWSCTRYSDGSCPLYLRCSLPSTRFLSAFHGHSYVPWWSSLVPAPSINWRRRTPAHQDGSHSESRNPRPASVETLSIPCLQTHAVLAIAFLFHTAVYVVVRRGVGPAWGIPNPCTVSNPSP